MFCEKCGAKIADTAKFCEFCGSTVASKKEQTAGIKTTAPKDNTPTLEKKEYFSMLASEETRSFQKKKTLSALVSGILTFVLFIGIMIIAVVAQNAIESAEKAGVLKILIILFVIFITESIIAIILSVKAVKSASPGMAVGAVAMSIFIGLAAGPAAFQALLSARKLNNEYKDYLIQKEGVRY